ncbi:G domain-containing protein, partial [Haematococcus lacustris]
MWGHTSLLLLQGLHAEFEASRLSFYEPRLEYWRQLWRVLDLCDIALMIVDARNPLLHFSGALTHHVLVEQRKAAVLVLNKCDLVPAASVMAWSHFFRARHPGLAVVAASAAEGQQAARNILTAVMNCQVVRDGRVVLAQQLVPGTIDTILQHSAMRNTVAKRRVAATGPGTGLGNAVALPVTSRSGGGAAATQGNTANAVPQAPDQAIAGRTKHYQTHFMAPGLMLCDCPGLVFPRVDVSLPMQILYGSFPIARCRDPYAVVAYLAAHMWPRLHLVLSLTKVDGDGKP